MDPMSEQATSTPDTTPHAPFDAFRPRWREAMDSEGAAFNFPLIDEAINLGERLVIATDATGQGHEFSLISALAHIDTVNDNRDEDSDDDEDLVDAADALVSEMTSPVNG